MLLNGNLLSHGGMTSYYLIAYSFSNTSAKNYQNRLMCIEVIVCNVTVVFFETQCSLNLFKPSLWRPIMSKCTSRSSSDFKGWQTGESFAEIHVTIVEIQKFFR